MQDAAAATAAPPSTSPSPAAVPDSSKLVDGKEELVLDFIPDKPLPTESLMDLVAEPTLNSLGLASWWPSGRLQYFMEQTHLFLDIPWWATICISTARIT